MSSKSYTPDPIFPPKKIPSIQRCHPTLLDLVVDDTEVVVSVVVTVVVMVWEVLVKVVVDNVVEVVVIVVPVLQWKEGKGNFPDSLTQGSGGQTRKKSICLKNYTNLIQNVNLYTFIDYIGLRSSDMTVYLEGWQDWWITRIY